MKDINLLINNGVNVYQSLELLGDIETYNDTLEDFLAGVEEKVNKMIMYKKATDMANYAIYAHSLKSDSKYLGFTRLADLSYQHELKAKADNLDFVLDNYDELERETTRIVSLVKQYLGKNNFYEVKSETTLVVSDKAILIADDSNIIRNFVEKIFTDNRFVVLTASDGRETIDMIEKDYDNRIMGLLLDLNMPEMDGFEVLNYFKEKNLFTKIPVSIITGDSSKEAIKKAYEYPIIDLISKPFKESEIIEAVEKILSVNEQ